MKRPRLALSLVLGAMAALVMFDGIPPADRGVAADFSQGAIDPLCPADFPRVCRFEWFERLELPAAPPAPTVLSLSSEEDESALVALVEQAQQATDLCYFLLAHFSWGYSPVESDRGLVADFDYGAWEAPAQHGSLANVPRLPAPVGIARGPVDESACPYLLGGASHAAPLSEVALGWRGFPALNWLSECDICPSYAMAQPSAPERAAVGATCADASTLMAIVRCESYDLAAELNEANQGIEPNPAELVVDLDDYDFDLALFAPEWLACSEEEEAYDEEDDELDAVDAGAAYESLTWHGWPLPGNWLSTPSEADWSAAATPDRCPLLSQREICVPLLPRSAQPSPCDAQQWRGDFAWYLLQQRASELAKQRVPAARPTRDPAREAQLSYSLADAMARLANLLNAASQELEDVTERIAREGAQREPRSVQIPREHLERREVKSSEIIWVEI